MDINFAISRTMKWTIAIAIVLCGPCRAGAAVETNGSPQVAGHESRMDAIIGPLSNESLEQSMGRLIDPDNQYGYITGILGGQNDLEAMLQNRRSVKVLQEIEKLPAKERPANCRQMFVQALEAHTNAWNMSLRGYEYPAFMENHQSLDGTIEALCTAMFITADTGQVDLLSVEFEQLDRVRREFEPRMSDNKLLHPQHGAWLLSEYIVPDNRFQVNALRLAATRVAGNAEMLRKCDAECALVGMGGDEMRIAPWDTPVDSKKVALTFTAYDWKGPDDILVNEAGEEEVVHKLRAIVLQRLPVDIATKLLESTPDPIR